MAGSIDYSLGLATRGFLGPLVGAQAALAAFAGFAAGTGGVLAGIFAQIEKGGQLADLRSRTGENIDTLFKLQEGFKIVGLEAGKVPQVIFQLQKALSGVSETGEATSDAFAALGITPDSLRGLDAIRQFSTVAERLAKLSKDDATGVAAKIFGRGASGDILQVARDFKSFEETLTRVDGQAKTFARSADAFDKLGDTLQALKTAGAGLFTELAAGAAPAFQAVLNSLQGFDLEGFGKRLGNALRAATAAFEKGQATELVALSLAAGFEKAVNVLERSLAAVFAATPELIQNTLGAAIKAVGLGLAGAVLGPFAKLLEAMSSSQFLGISPDSPVGRGLREQAAGFRLLGEVAKEEAPRAFEEAATSFFAAAKAGANGFGGGVAGPNEQRLNALLAGLLPPLGEIPGGDPKANRAINLLGGGGGRGDGSADSLTRIGFFSGGGSGTDMAANARITAQSTRESAKLLARMTKAMEDTKTIDFVNR